MTPLEFDRNIVPAQVFCLKQQREVEGKVGGFADQFLPVALDRRQGDFDALFADLLRHALDALAGKAGGVAASPGRAVARDWMMA